MLHFHGYFTLHGYKTSTLTAWKISIPIPVKNLEGQSIHGIRQAKKGLKGLKLCKGNLSEKKNSEENVSSVPINIYYVCVFSLSLGITILPIKWSTLLTHLWKCLHWKRTASMCIHHNSRQESPGTSVWDRHRSCTVPHLLQHWHTRLRRFVQVNWLI